MIKKLANYLIAHISMHHITLMLALRKKYLCDLWMILFRNKKNISFPAYIYLLRPLSDLISVWDKMKRKVIHFCDVDEKMQIVNGDRIFPSRHDLALGLTFQSVHVELSHFPCSSQMGPHNTIAMNAGSVPGWPVWLLNCILALGTYSFCPHSPTLFECIQMTFVYIKIMSSTQLKFIKCKKVRTI